jgi:3-methyladenine DNA glycosylase AlkD
VSPTTTQPGTITEGSETVDIAAAAATPSSPTSRSAVTERAVAFVAERKPRAEALGGALADHIGDPDGFATALRAAFVELADPEYLEGQHRVAPGLGLVHGVRWPLMAAIARGFRQATRRDRPTSLLFVADRLFREPELEARWFAFGLLERTLPGDAERTWQLLRRAAREAGDWITVDSLAHPYGIGIAAEPYRWAELEQLVFSPSPWERRLIGSTIATMTHGTRRGGHAPGLVADALRLLGQLMGDAAPDVQKALSWAYRSLAQLDGPATLAALERETDLAVAGDDGHRAWVIRDALSKLDPAAAARLRDQLAGIRKRPGAASTSDASATAARFGGLPDPRFHPEPPLA